MGTPRMGIGAFCLCLAMSVLPPRGAAEEGAATNAITRLPSGVVMRGLKGGYVHLSGLCYAGEELPRSPRHTLILSFLSTTCVPCKQELPLLLRLTRQYRDRGVKTFVVCVDGLSKQPDVEAMVTSFGIDCDVLLEPYKMNCGKLKVEATPRTLVFAPTGEIVGDIGGAETNFESTLTAILERATGAGRQGLTP